MCECTVLSTTLRPMSKTPNPQLLNHSKNSCSLLRVCVHYSVETWFSKEKWLSNSTPRFLTGDADLTNPNKEAIMC